VAVEVALTGLIVVFGLYYRRFLAPVLALAQLAISLYLELGGHLPEVEPARLFWFDRLSLVMVLIIGLIGPLIGINAIGYMRSYHRASPMLRGRRNVFFGLLFVFLSGMFGLVVSNYPAPDAGLLGDHDPLLVLLIGYTRTDETIGYAFRAAEHEPSVGGLGFAAAIALLADKPAAWTWPN